MAPTYVVLVAEVELPAVGLVGVVRDKVDRGRAVDSGPPAPYFRRLDRRWLDVTYSQLGRLLDRNYLRATKIDIGPNYFHERPELAYHNIKIGIMWYCHAVWDWFGIPGARSQMK